MRKLESKKGFTLIELLAVIVVLAIVTIIATQSILPFMDNAGRDSFASEANLALDAASDAMSLISIGSITDNYKYTPAATTDNAGTYCFTLDNLKNLGIWTKDDDSYEGSVLVTVPTDNAAYTYSIHMHSAEYYVKTSEGTIKTKNYDATNEPNTEEETPEETSEEESSSDSGKAYEITENFEFIETDSSNLYSEDNLPFSENSEPNIKLQAFEFSSYIVESLSYEMETKLSENYEEVYDLAIKDDKNILADGISEKAVKEFAEYVADNAPTQSNVRGSAEYRTNLVKVLTQRALMQIGGMQ